MKKIISVVLAVILSVTLVPFANAEQTSIYTDIGDNRARLDKAVVENGVALCNIDAGGLTIVELGAELCSYSSIGSIEFPEKLERIGYAAFLGCSELESLEIPLTVKIIETFAFSECYGLKTVTIPETVEHLGEWAFDFGDVEVKVYKDSYAEQYCIDNGYEYTLADEGCTHKNTESVICEYAACTYNGEKAQRCSDCGKLTKREEIAALGHSFGAWQINEGTRSRECSLCGNSFEGIERSYVPLLFTDIEKGSWYYESVEFCFTNGFVNGTSATAFKPDGNTTRAMVVQILSRYAGADLSKYTESGFNDVKLSEWYGPAVAWAKESGVVKGNDKGEFMPNVNVNREQLTVIMKNFADFMGYSYSESNTDISESFTDGVSASDWAKEGMNWAVSLGIVNGVGGGKLNPKGLAGRNQIVKIIKYFADIFEPETVYGYDRVVVFMIDGAGDYLKDANTPNIDKIFNLAVSSKASAPVNCMSEKVSILTGTEAAVHGYTHRDDAARYTYNERNGIKTFLGEVKEAYPEKEVACFASSLEITQLAEQGIYAPIKGDKMDNEMTDILCNEGGYLENHDPSLLFVEMRQVLQASIHFEGGYGGRDYMTQLELTDGYIGRIYNKYEELGRNENTLYIITTDHGGVAGTSGVYGESDEVLNCFFGLGGKGVNADPDLTGFCNTDIYGIVLDVFGIDRPYISNSKKYNLFTAE